MFHSEKFQRNGNLSTITLICAKIASNLSSLDNTTYGAIKYFGQNCGISFSIVQVEVGRVSVERSRKTSKIASLLEFDEHCRTEGHAPYSNGSTQLKLIQRSYSYLIGVDEVGRGCLAGPVMAAAVVLPAVIPDGSKLMEGLTLLNDSKQLTPNQREKLAEVITGNSLYAYGYAAPKEIDEINILNATLLAMERSVQELLKNLPIKDTLVAVDGKTALDKLPCSQLPIAEGDSKSAAIAAASVIAKVRRDFLMLQLHKVYPDYGWEKNKGYPSRLHLSALGKVGPSPLHRMSFSWCG